MFSQYNDISLDIQRAKSAKRLYIIVFIGANGVGKSTTIAKLAKFLTNNQKCKTLIAACDTFRSGAVEQLKIHSQALNIDLFENGYGKDPVKIAESAKNYALLNNYDVLLIDTAGRLHTNKDLLSNLAKLISSVSPNKSLFISEALVGNKSIEQLKGFEYSIKKISNNKFGVDGLILTKIDTVGEKLGSIINMIYQAKKDVFFLGTGQSYDSINILDVSLL